MARFVKFIGVHGEVAVNPERVLYAAPLPETGDCWLYFGGKGEAEEGHPAVIVVQVKGSLDEVVAVLEGPAREADPPAGDQPTDAKGDDRPPLQAAAEDEPPLLPPPDHD
jgi:hypothetical protein